MSDEELAALEDPSTWTSVFDDRVHAALTLADAMSAETHALDPELIEELRFHYNETELAELVLVCGQANLNNRVGNAAKQLLG